RPKPLQFVRLSALGKRVVKLELDVEMILDHRLVAAGHEDEMLDPRLACLIDHILDDRPVDDREHFLGNRLRGWQEACAEAGNRKDGLSDFLHLSESRISGGMEREAAILCQRDFHAGDIFMPTLT